MLDPGSREFAGDDVVDDLGMDRALDPGEVWAVAGRYFAEPIRIVGL
jgi:hypothetical protein